MSVLTINKLTGTVGAEVSGIDPDQLASDDALAEAVLDELEANGVLVFRGLHLAPETQVAFCTRLGDVDRTADGFVRQIGESVTFVPLKSGIG